MKEVPAAVEAARKKAEEHVADHSKVSRLLDRAQRKAYRDRSRILEMWETLQALLGLLTAWAQGRYKTVPWRTLVLAIAGILYFVDPLDCFPDPIPFLGYLDDAGVLALVVRSIQKDIDRFLAWERANY
jgi:uncharacterized membrane protein YkvA (DUF1232 family)